MKIKDKSVEGKRKVVMCSYYWLTTKGGITTFVYNLVTSMRKSNRWDIMVISTDKEQSEYVKSISTRGFLASIETFFLFLKMHPEIIHIHGYGWMLLAAIVYKSIFQNTKVIRTFHTQPMLKKYIQDRGCCLLIQNGFKRRVQNYLLSKCDYFTCPSNSLYNNLVQNGFPLSLDKTRIINGGVNDTSVPINDVIKLQETHGIDQDYPILTICSVFEWEAKVAGIIKLVEAVKQLKENCPKIKLVIIGDGSFRQYIEEKVSSLGLKKNVLITGYVSNPLTFVAASHVYCHISFSEGLSLAILEAMILGKPIVASNTGGIPEQIASGETGLLVDNTVAEITKAILRLLKDTELADMLGTNARALAINKFSWQLCTDRFVELYMRN